jgi:hypothetical protein
MCTVILCSYASWRHVVALLVVCVLFLLLAVVGGGGCAGFFAFAAFFGFWHGAAVAANTREAGLRLYHAPPVLPLRARTYAKIATPRRAAMMTIQM